jgi:peptidoglycan/LPS O-acetylase OafA/YrhL
VFEVLRSFRSATSIACRLRTACLAQVQVPLRDGHLALLDGWRGLCILLVMVGHCFPSLGFLGLIGVEFFFVLSGRLMADLLILKRQPLGLFVRRRFARVVPALAIYALVAGALVNMSSISTGGNLRLVSPVAALLFVHNYLPIEHVVGVLEHSWSLAVEEHSYLVLIAIAAISGRRPVLAVSAAFLVSILLLINGMYFEIPKDGGQQITWRSDYRIVSVVLSFAVFGAMRLATERATTIRIPWYSPLATMLAMLAILFLNPAYPAQLIIGTCFAALAVNTIESAGTRWRECLQHPFLLWAGTISFSLYLWQQLAFSLAGVFELPAVTAVAGSVVCALGSYRYIENPAREFLNSRSSAKCHHVNATPPAIEDSGVMPQSLSGVR